MGYPNFGVGSVMPKAKPTQVFVHRIELQEKEREYLETLQMAQTIKNLGFTAAALGITGVGYLAWKTFHEVWTNEEPSIFNVLTKDGRAAYAKKIQDDPAGTFRKALFDPTALNPFI